MLQNRVRQRGSTMIELLIALMIVGVVVTAIALAGTYSIKNTSEARYKQVATTLAQEVLEKSRAEENRLGFTAFSHVVGSNTFCFTTLPDEYEASSLLDGECGSSDTISLAGTDFTRQVSFSSTPTAVEMEVTVSWQDGDNTRSITQKQQLLKQSFN